MAANGISERSASAFRICNVSSNCDVLHHPRLRIVTKSLRSTPLLYSILSGTDHPSMLPSWPPPPSPPAKLVRTLIQANTLAFDLIGHMERLTT